MVMMKTLRCYLPLLTLLPAFLMPLILLAQVATAPLGPVETSLPAYPDSLFPTYYHQRVSHFETLPRSGTDILFLGNSITDGAEWSELFSNARIRNRGISGDITAGVIHRLAYLAEGHPAKVFLLIGINDLARGTSPDSVVKNILLIADYLRQQTPATRLYIQSLLPVNDSFGKFGTHTNKGREVLAVNRALSNAAGGHHYTYLDLYDSFCDPTGRLQSAFTNDGLHLTGEGYLLWKHLLYPDICDLSERPALIPQPWRLQWNPGYFRLSRCAGIAIDDSSLLKEATILQEGLLRKGVRLPIVKGRYAEVAIDSGSADGSRLVGQVRRIPDKENYIHLRLGVVTVGVGGQTRDATRDEVELGTGGEVGSQAAGGGLQDEAYRLAVSPGGIVIEANSSHGIFDGEQTLLQLARDGGIVDGCSITDWPAFSWRGYMVDVGRNFQSLRLLKQQIDVMGRYKLNVFHMHLTEDIAWRIAVKAYPQLTAAGAMLRDAGGFYSENDILELMAYCSERHIEFLPEIDMPGHSGAFARALKMDMQSAAGVSAVKTILRELIATYHFKYIHIGGDEVQITDTTFLPGILALLDSTGVRAIGWEPGGNLGSACLRQLWKGYGAIADTQHVYIDSRHLYLNHMDPLESVVTIFNRQVGGVNAQTRNIIGGTLCLWNDRAVASENDLLRMNPVYPGMLAFAERCWRGGGKSRWVAGIGEPGR